MANWLSSEQLDDDKCYFCYVKWIHTNALCQVAVAPMRKVASDRSEQVSQLLFGESVDIIEAKGRSWLYVRSRRDKYLGWVDPKQLMPVALEWLEKSENNFAITVDTIQAAFAADLPQNIPIGSTLSFFDGMNFYLGNRRFQYSGQAIVPGQLPAKADLVIKLARRFLGSPYAWGGRSPLGIDCSGYTQIVFSMLDIALPRDAQEQALGGVEVPFAEMAQVGDLAFFDNGSGKIIHVGIVMPEGRILHASGEVREDRFDGFGIFREDWERYSHDLRFIKRFLPQFEVLSVKPEASTSIEAAQLFST